MTQTHFSINGQSDIMSEHTTEVEGTISVCAHNVTYSYEVEYLIVTPEMEQRLREEAESRAQVMIIEGYHSGELNCVWECEHEIRGWWQIE